MRRGTRQHMYIHHCWYSSSHGQYHYHGYNCHPHPPTIRHNYHPQCRWHPHPHRFNIWLLAPTYTIPSPPPSLSACVMLLTSVPLTECRPKARQATGKKARNWDPTDQAPKLLPEGLFMIQVFTSTSSPVVLVGVHCASANVHPEWLLPTVLSNHSR